MDLIPLERIEKVVSNLYEAVAIAAKEARRINLCRKREEAKGTQDETKKVTVEALKRLTSGKIRYLYRSDEPLFENE